MLETTEAPKVVVKERSAIELANLCGLIASTLRPTAITSEQVSTCCGAIAYSGKVDNYLRTWNFSDKQQFISHLTPKKRGVYSTPISKIHFSLGGEVLDFIAENMENINGGIEKKEIVDGDSTLTILWPIESSPLNNPVE